MDLFMLEKIHNPFVNIPAYNCFVCSPANTKGLRLEFYKDSDSVVSFYTAPDFHSGMPHLMHGGISAVMMDEIMFWAIFVFEKKICFTTHIALKYKKVTPIGEKITIRGRVKENKRRFYSAVGEIVNEKGEAFCTGEGTYFAADSHTVKQAFGVEDFSSELKQYLD